MARVAPGHHNIGSVVAFVTLNLKRTKDRASHHTEMCDTRMCIRRKWNNVATVNTIRGVSVAKPVRQFFSIPSSQSAWHITIYRPTLQTIERKKNKEPHFLFWVRAYILYTDVVHMPVTCFQMHDRCTQNTQLKPCQLTLLCCCCCCCCVRLPYSTYRSL